MSKLMANIGVSVAALLCVLWVFIVSPAWNWVSSQSALFALEVGLLRVRVKKRIVTSALAAGAKLFGQRLLATKVDHFLDRTMWLQEGATQFCELDRLFQWCYSWNRVKFASWFMFLSGIGAAAALAAGGGFFWWYEYKNPEPKKRFWARVCFATAPCTAALGMVTYSFCTFDFGRDQQTGHLEAQANYNKGYVFACMLTVLSWIPLYILMMLSKESIEEAHDLMVAPVYTGPQLPQPLSPRPLSPRPQSPRPQSPRPNYDVHGPALGNTYGATAGGPQLAAPQPYVPAPNWGPGPGFGAPAW